MKLDKNCILKDQNSENEFRKLIAEFLKGVATGEVVINPTEFVPGSTEAPSVKPKGEAKKKNKKKKKDKAPETNGHALPDSPEKKVPSAGEDATDESPLKPMKSASIESFEMKPQAAVAKPKPSKREATLNLSEQLLANMRFLGGNAPSQRDKVALEAIGDEPPSAEFHPNVYAWWSIVSKYTEETKNAWE